MSHRIHNLAPLREEIKTNALGARQLRAEARETSHDARYELKAEANWAGSKTRYPHLACGYLCGRTISEMESEHTRPENLPRASSILAAAKDAWLKGPDTADPAPSWDDFKAHVEADIKAWKAKCLANHAMRQARKLAEVA